MNGLLTFVQVLPDLGSMLVPDEQAVMLWGLAFGGAVGALIAGRQRALREARIERRRRELRRSPSTRD